MRLRCGGYNVPPRVVGRMAYAPKAKLGRSFLTDEQRLRILKRAAELSTPKGVVECSGEVVSEKVVA